MFDIISCCIIYIYQYQYQNSVDIWCLGITVYNMTYGVTPFEAPEGSKDWQKVTMHNIQFKQLNFIESKRVSFRFFFFSFF